MLADHVFCVIESEPWPMQISSVDRFTILPIGLKDEHKLLPRLTSESVEVDFIIQEDALQPRKTI